jgi:hypothetical protein
MTAAQTELEMLARQSFINGWGKKMLAQVAEPIFDEVMNHKRMPDWRHGHHPQTKSQLTTIKIRRPPMLVSTIGS